MNKKVLLVEDDRSIATVIKAALEEDNFTVMHCTDVAERDRMLGTHNFAVMLTDVMLGDEDGIESLGPVQSAAPDMPIIVLSAQNTFETAVRASEIEAFEYFPKPFDLDELVRAVSQAAGSHMVEMQHGLSETDGMPLVGRSQAMQSVFRLITRVLRNDLKVLITGESGTGKELVAEAIHQLGARKSGPFVAVNTAAIPSELIESELFGHEKGAFTGAVAQTIGKFEQANGGTLFLDEIGDMPADAQTRLLRALQSNRIRRVGGRQEIAVDVRIIAATNRDLAPLIADGKFREDLFYRLNVVPIELPPLRERRGDIAVLSRHFLNLAAEDGLARRQITSDAIQQLEQRQWRGNIRELRNVIYRLALLARDEMIDAHAIDEVIGPEAEGAPETERLDFEGALKLWLADNHPAPGVLYHSALAAFEKPLMEYALEQTQGNQLRAAKLLGINRNTLRKRLGELAINADRFARAL